MGINMVINPFWFVLLIFAFYIIAFISRKVLLPTFTIFFSKPLKELNYDTIYMLLIYILLIFIFTFTSTPILDFILINNSMDYLEISLPFAIVFTGLLRIIAVKKYHNEVAFIIYCQVIFNLLALIIFCSFSSYGSDYFLRIHDEFLIKIEQGYFQFSMIPLLIILFSFIENFLKRITF